MVQDEQQLGIIAKFDKCPVCGSTERLMSTLADEVKAKGLIPEDFNPVPLTFITPPIRDPRKPVIIGMKYTNAIVIVDVCMGCGTLYAPQILRGYMQPEVANQPRM